LIIEAWRIFVASSYFGSARNFNELELFCTDEEQVKKLFSVLILAEWVTEYPNNIIHTSTIASDLHPTVAKNDYCGCARQVSIVQ
jgi:hypothetical protein